MKTLITAATIVAFAAPVAAAEQVTASVEDFYATVVESTPYTKQVCQQVEVPIYGTVTRQGSGASGGDVLGGMILGAILGKGITDKDNGAAAGAVIGGVIAADKAKKPKTETVITGYKYERQCEDITEYRDVNKKVYDYSVITWTVNGITYQTAFTK